MDDGLDLLLLRHDHSGQVGGVHASRRPGALGNLVHLDPVHLAAGGEEQQPVVSGRGEDVADDVLFLETGPAHPTPSAALAAVRFDGQPLHVAGSRHRDDDVLLGHQVLDRHLALVRLDLGPPLVRVSLLDVEELLLDDAADLLGVGQQGLQVLDPGQQILVLLLQLRPRKLGQAAQRHVQDVVGLDLGELESGHQPGPGHVCVLRGSDDLDDLVDVIEGDQQALDDVVALLGPPQLVPGAPRDDLDLVVDVVADHLDQGQNPRDVVDEGEHDDAERVLKLRVLVELVQDDVRIGAGPQLDDQAEVVLRLVADGRLPRAGCVRRRRASRAGGDCMSASLHVGTPADVLRTSAAEQAALVRSGGVSARELVLHGRRAWRRSRRA